MQVPEELELELETERESARETERQAKQFESEIKPKQSSRSNNSSRAGVETLLRLKNANSHDLIIAVQDMQQRQQVESDSQVQQEMEPNQPLIRYKDFISYEQEKDKLNQMFTAYQSQNTTTELHSPSK